MSLDSQLAMHTPCYQSTIKLKIHSKKFNVGLVHVIKTMTVKLTITHNSSNRIQLPRRVPHTQRVGLHKVVGSKALPSQDWRSLSETPSCQLFHTPLVVLSLSHWGLGEWREARQLAEGGSGREREASDEGDGNQQAAVYHLMNWKKESIIIRMIPLIVSFHFWKVETVGYSHRYERKGGE